ncbi:MAG TPA: hypothetical protein VN611_18295 [Patescibacteria group bacterium]|nr:hypothetical protein [Patescibacteria group bacterium]
MPKNKWIQAGVATGIGSLPHQTEAEALAVVAGALPYWPHWPQLPAKHDEQGFVVQYVQPLRAHGLLNVIPPRDPVFVRRQPGWEECSLAFYEAYLAFVSGNDTGYFSLQGEAFAGLDAFVDRFDRLFPAACGVKGQVSGPLTVGLQIKDEEGRACFYDDNLRDILVKCLAIQAVLVARRLKALGKPVLLFLDDPGLFLIGSSHYITLIPEICRQALLEAIELLHREDVRVGVHACSGMDWSLLFDLPLDMVSFDAYHYFPSMLVQASALQAYLEWGGHLAWGIVPTSDEAWQETPESLATRFAAQEKELVERGVDRDLLREQMIWTPSCGTGALPVDLAEQVYRLLGALNF